MAIQKWGRKRNNPKGLYHNKCNSINLYTADYRRGNCWHFSLAEKLFECLLASYKELQNKMLNIAKISTRNRYLITNGVSKQNLPLKKVEGNAWCKRLSVKHNGEYAARPDKALTSEHTGPCKRYTVMLQKVFYWQKLCSSSYTALKPISLCKQYTCQIPMVHKSIAWDVINGYALAMSVVNSDKTFVRDQMNICPTSKPTVRKLKQIY